MGALAILSLSLVNADIAESETGSSNGDVALLFVAGMAGAAAMIVPGFSGSFMLVALGVYWHLLEAVRGGDMLTLIPANAGGLVGIIVVSRPGGPPPPLYLQFLTIASWALSRLTI